MNLELINQKIHQIREHKVILDYDLAELYQVETRVLKQAVRRNLDRFPSDFMFELTPEENNFLRSHIVILENGRGTFSKYLPFAFTEQGVAMLSSVLKSQTAIQVNISIMRAFVTIRHIALTNKELSQRLMQMEEEYNKQFNDIYEVLDFLVKKDQQIIQQEKRIKIGFK
jgi:hypothetical protein